MTNSKDDETVVVQVEKPLQQLNKVAKRPPLNVTFRNLKYFIDDKQAEGGRRPLLQSVNGEFRSGELTVIMGPSGAGKTTLLNILAGYVTNNVEGSIETNGRPRDLKRFKKLSSYILQEDVVQPYLTVLEAMNFAAAVKLGPHVKPSQRRAVIDEVLELLGLDHCRRTRSEHLSGGERKRLSIALELVNNPPVIFLDEPTTGLDNVAVKHCMELLRKISLLGRTVICTAHQPPSSLFQMFDQVYILADGCCVYNDAPGKLVPFLSRAGCPCPQNYTPADYVIEIVNNHSEIVPDLTRMVQGGKSNMADPKGDQEEAPCECLPSYDMDFPTSFWSQFSMLIHRTFLQMSRNRLMLYLQLLHHLLTSLAMGLVLYNIGTDGSQTMATYKLINGLTSLLVFTYTMSPVLLVPFEIKLMQREYLNRWYSFKAYYLAMSISGVPLIIILNMMFSTIVYVLTVQPKEPDRILGFFLTGVMVAFISQSLGHAIGAVCSPTVGSIVCSAVAIPHVFVAFYGMGYKNTIEPSMKFLMSLDFARSIVVAYSSSLYYERAPLECNSDIIYCHYANPAKLLEDMGVPSVHYWYPLSHAIWFLVAFKVVFYVALRHRLNSKFLG